VDKYTWLIKKTPYVEQAMLAKPPPYRFFFDDKEGVIARDRVIESKDQLKNGTTADTK